MLDPAGALEIAEELRLNTAVVEQVLVRADVVGKLLRISRMARIGGTIILSSRLARSLCSSYSTPSAWPSIRGREEIEIMKLIGATDWFVRGPFVIEGAFIGLGGCRNRCGRLRGRLFELWTCAQLARCIFANPDRDGFHGKTSRSSRCWWAWLLEARGVFLFRHAVSRGFKLGSSLP